MCAPVPLQFVNVLDMGHKVRLMLGSHSFSLYSAHALHLDSTLASSPTSRFAWISLLFVESVLMSVARACPCPCIQIVEYNQENLRITSLEGGSSLIRSFPSKVSVRAFL